MTQHNNILFHEKKENDFEHTISEQRLWWWENRLLGSIKKCINLPPGEWEIVGLSKEMTEEKWKSLVKEACFAGDRPYWGYKNYEEGMPFETASASGLSLMRHLGLDEKQNYLILKLKGGKTI